MSMYIKGCSTISAQPTFELEKIPAEIKEFNGDSLSVSEPNYENIIDPRSIRRMSKIIRMSVAAAKKAMANAGIDLPDGIITGTSYGCLEDTESFLQKMITNNEEVLNPTPFIQSTHNTISGQIALLLKCYGYNSTYTQRGFSFENCLVDAQMQLQEKPDQNILVGGVDEIIEQSHDILKRFDLYRSGSNLDLISKPANGTMNGEGSAYLILSGNSENAIAEIVATKTFLKPASQEIIDKNIRGFLESQNLKTEDIDVLLIGRSGDLRFDPIYDQVEKQFSKSTIAVFKQMCGEYPTASAFATWLASMLIETKELPSYMVKNNSHRSSFDNILIYNHYFGTHHSLILLK